MHGLDGIFVFLNVFHLLELSFYLLQNEKPLGPSASRSSNISKVSKAHTVQMRKILIEDVQPGSITEKREHTCRQEDDSEVSCI